MKWSSGWALDEIATEDGSERSGRVVLSAGLDRLVEIDGLFDTDIDTLRRWAAGGSICTDDVSGHLVDQLVGLGVLVADVVPRGTPAPILITVIGDGVSAALAARVAERLNAGATVKASVRSDSCADESMLIALRTGDRVEVDHRMDRPVLHVDLRHQHTVVVGPTELPGISACDTCYDLRLARRWRIPNLPARPDVLDHQQLAAELVVFHANRFLATSTHLINATIAQSLRDGAATIDTVLRFPTCFGCGPSRTTTGQVRLPWHSGSSSP